MIHKPSTFSGNRPLRTRLAGVSLIAFVAFLAIAIALTCPLVAGMSERIFTPGVSHDGVGTIAQTWYTDYARQNGWDGRITTFFAYPFGYDLTSVNYPLTNGLMTLMARAVGAQASYNVMIIASFPFAGLAMFLLVYYVTRSTWASLLGGFIYAFSPWHVFRAFDQVTLAQIYVLPLFLLSLLYLWKKRDLPSALGVLVTFAVALLTDYHFGLFCGLLLSCWAFASWLYARTRGKTGPSSPETRHITRRSSVKLAVLALASILAATVLCAPALKDLLYKDPTVVSETGERGTDVVVSYSAHPMDYLVPPAYALIWRGVTSGYVAEHTGKSGTHEVTDYPGIITYALAGTAVFLTFRRRKKQPGEPPDERGDTGPAAFDAASAAPAGAFSTPEGDERGEAPCAAETGVTTGDPVEEEAGSDPVARKAAEPGGEDLPASFGSAKSNGDGLCHRIVYFGIVCAVAAFVLSMPPIVTIGGVDVPTPSIIMRALAPPFRFYSRWALVVTFSLALLAAIGFHLFVKARHWTSRKALIAALVCAVLFALDTTIVPPSRSQVISTPPATVAALAEYPENQPVAFYPLSPGRYFIPRWYHYYQMEHKHPMLNGSKPGTVEDQYNSVLKDIYAPYTPAMLKGLGIDKAVVLSEYFEIMFPVGLKFDPAMMPPGYRLARKTSDGYIFDLTGPAAGVFPLYYTNFTPPAVLEDGKAWSAMLRPKAEFRIDNKAGSVTKDFSVAFNNPGGKGRISAALDGEKIGEIYVGHGDGSLTIKGVRLDEKEHFLSIEWDGQPVRTGGEAFGRGGSIDIYLLVTRPEFST